MSKRRGPRSQHYAILYLSVTCLAGSPQARWMTTGIKSLSRVVRSLCASF